MHITLKDSSEQIKADNRSDGTIEMDIPILLGDNATIKLPNGKKLPVLLSLVITNEFNYNPNQKGNQISCLLEVSATWEKIRAVNYIEGVCLNPEASVESVLEKYIKKNDLEDITLCDLKIKVIELYHRLILD
jgi:hypothetical protein